MTKVRAYDRGRDFDRVGDLLVKTFLPGYQSHNWLQARWEYMHFHPALNVNNLHKNGIWEDAFGNVVAVVHFEGDIGEAYFQVRPDMNALKSEMIEYAEAHLHAKGDDGTHVLRLFIDGRDLELQHLAADRGYQKDQKALDPISEFAIPDVFPKINVPEGFRLQSLAEENDLHKVNRVLYRGFNHPGEPPEEEIEGRKLMQSAPNFAKDLAVVAVAPDGNYASFCGMWYDPVNRIAMVEPVATDPEYRRLGAGRAAVLEGIRRCARLGATVAYVGSKQEFYLSFGFRFIFGLNVWTRQW